jgi:hypothetical protein
VLQKLHLELEKLFIQVIHAAGQRSMALLHSLFIGLESRKMLPLSHVTFIGSDAVSVLHSLMFCVLFAISRAAANTNPISVSNNPFPPLIIRVIAPPGIASSGFWSCVFTELRLPLSAGLFGWLLRRLQRRSQG